MTLSTTSKWGIGKLFCEYRSSLSPCIHIDTIPRYFFFHDFTDLHSRLSSDCGSAAHTMILLVAAFSSIFVDRSSPLTQRISTCVKQCPFRHMARFTCCILHSIIATARIFPLDSFLPSSTPLYPLTSNGFQDLTHITGDEIHCCRWCVRFWKFSSFPALVFTQHFISFPISHFTFLFSFHFYHHVVSQACICVFIDLTAHLFSLV